MISALLVLAITLVSNLRTYQLFQIPPADLHVATVLIQTLGKVLGIKLAAPGTVSFLRISALLLGCHGVICGLLLYWLAAAAAAAEEAPDSMAD